jgi:hypothetical protein
MSTQHIVQANSLINRRAKMGALLMHVNFTGNEPRGLNAATQQVWDAMLTLGIVRCHAGRNRGRVYLTHAGEVLCALAIHGDL